MPKPTPNQDPTTRGSHNPTIAAGLTHWRSMNAQQRKEAVLQALVEITEELGMPPLRRELADKCGMDLKTVRRYLAALEDEGLITEPGGPGTRTLRVVVAKPAAKKTTKSSRKR